MNIKRYLKICGALLIVDWALGAAQAAHVVPLWIFLAANFPFGGVYVWFESHWTGNQYRLGDQVLSEAWPLFLFFPIVLAQAWVYYLLFSLWLRRRAHTASMRSP